MPRTINRSVLSAEDLAELRKVQAQRKRESRARKLAEGKCLVCGQNDVIPGTNPNTDDLYKTCRECNIESYNREKARGRTVRPSTLVLKMFTDGESVKEITAETGLKPTYVRNVIAKKGWTPE